MERGRLWTALALGGAIAAGALLAGAEAPAKKPPAIVFTTGDLDGGVIVGHYQHPEAVYVVPRSESAKKAVDSTGDHHLDEALPQHKP